MALLIQDKIPGMEESEVVAYKKPEAGWALVQWVCGQEGIPS